MLNVELEWKEFSVNLKKVKEALRLIDETCELSANSKLVAHCSDELSEEQVQEIKDYWEALDEESEEATSYISAEDEKAAAAADIAAKKASARAKLLVLGLSEEECGAVLGA